MIKALETFEEEQIEKKRKACVTKANNLIQKSRYSLNLMEQRIILYTLSQIKHTDVSLSEMKFNINTFFKLCGVDNHNYQYLKDTLQKLKSKTFWIVIDDKGTESCVSWFSTLRMNKRSGVVTLKFDDDLAPFILQLKQQFTSYSIFPTLVMKSRYSIRLYELLKSYQGLEEWWFELDDFKRKMDAENYDKYADIRRYVIEVAVAEINKFTDIEIDWRPIKQGRQYTKIQFFVKGKSPYYNLLAEQEVQGQLML